MKVALFVLLGLMVVVVGGALLAGPQLQSALSSFAPAPQRTKVRMETVQPRRLVQTVKAPGQIEPRTKVEISAEVSARIEALPFDEGDHVRKGDMVVKLDDASLAAALLADEARLEGEAARLESERANLTRQLSSLGFARTHLERQQALYDTGDIARQQLDDAVERVQDLEAQVESSRHILAVIESSLAAAKADIDRAKESLEKTIIRSPMDGIITARNAEVGEVVLVGTMNNPGTVIMTVADLSRMILNAEVAESDVALLKESQSATVHINAYRDDPFSGTVTALALQRTDKLDGTGYFKTEVEIDSQGRRILSGLMANVDIAVAEHEGLAVESQAIVDRLLDQVPDRVKRDNPLVDTSRRSATVVYRVIDGKAVCTPVKRGASDDTHSIVLAGLDEGDVVIVGPFKVLEQIKDDELVTDEASADAAGAAGQGAAEDKDEGGVRVRVGR